MSRGGGFMLNAAYRENAFTTAARAPSVIEAGVQAGSPVSEGDQERRKATCALAEAVSEPTATASRRCLDCGRTLPRGRSHRKYCCAVCRARASRRRRTVRLTALLDDIENLLQTLLPKHPRLYYPRDRSA